MRSINLFALLPLSLALFTGCSAVADSGHHIPGSQEAVDPALAADLQKALEVSSKDVVGVSAAVIIPEQGMWLGNAGWADPHLQKPMHSELVFEVGSLTKNFTAAAVLKFYEHCGETGVPSVCLDDPLIQYIPQYKGCKFPRYKDCEKFVTNGATLRQTLDMTSGIYSLTSNNAYWLAVSDDFGRYFTPQFLIENYLKEPDFTAGSEYEYSNSNFVLAGIVLQGLLDTYDISPFFRTELFERNHLDQTFFGGYETVNGPIADNWTQYLGNGELQNVSAIPRRSSATSSWTSGSFLGTPDDMALWIDALYRRKVVLSQDALDQMLKFVPVGSEERSKGRRLVGEIQASAWWDGYGLGTMRMHIPTPGGREMLYGYGGNTDAFTSYSFYLPSREVTISFLINQGQTDTQRIEIATALVQVLCEQLPAVSS